MMATRSFLPVYSAFLPSILVDTLSAILSAPVISLGWILDTQYAAEIKKSLPLCIK
jgi:hypothetical protein